MADQDRKLLIRIEHYSDPNPRDPRSFPLFEARMMKLERDVELLKVGTVGLDSFSYLLMGALKYDQYKFNPGLVGDTDIEKAKNARLTKHALQWYGAASLAADDYARGALPGLVSVNSVLIAHLGNATEAHPDAAHQIAAYGQTPAQVPSAYSEVWRTHTRLVEAEGGAAKLGYFIQTRNRDGYKCKSALELPDPLVFVPDKGYDLIRANAGWKGGVGPNAHIKAVIVGESGTGKSTLLASFAKVESPLLVLLFDAPGQAAAYLKRGEAGPLTKWDYGYYQNVYAGG